MTKAVVLTMALLVFLSFQKAHARDVDFSWKPMEGISKYEIQIATDEKFEHVITSSKLDKPEFQTPLGIGQYFYRVRVYDMKEKPGKWSKSAAVTVSPYAPELVDPKSGFQTSYYEIQPDMVFKWKAVEGSPEYEILIQKTTGQKIAEQRVTGTEFKTNLIPDGDYTWKVRALHQKIYLSDYSGARAFTITKNPLTAPVLVKPEKDGVSPAYRPVPFEWKQDPHTHYTDMTFEKLRGVEGAKPFKKTVDNIQAQNYTADYEEPGSYVWSVNTKEGKNTPGISSETQAFQVRNDIITRGNYELEFSYSPVSDLYSTTSSRQTGGNSFIAQQSTSTGTFTGFQAGYYFWESLGVFAGTRTAKLGIESINGEQQETDFQLRLRFGSPGFNQEFIYGYRIMDIVEAENTPVQEATDFTTMGPLLGTRINATIVDNWRASLFGYYYKPLSNMEGIGNLTADVLGASVEVKWNFMYQFWLGYRFSFDRINASFITPGQGPGVNAGWTMYRTEPFFISLSFEH